MDLNEYFDPVSIEKPNQTFLKNEDTFGRNISIHTPNVPISQIPDADLAILGIPEERNSPNKGCAGAPDKIRDKLYQLFKFPAKIRITDLGNLKAGSAANDTYYAVRDILFELTNANVFPVILGGSQDITYGMFSGFQMMKKPVNLVTVDSRIDLSGPGEEFSSQNYLQKIFTEKKKNLFHYTNIGHQIHFTPQSDIESLKKSFFETYRMGMARSDMSDMEPVFRDATIVSIDIGAIRQSDAPGHFGASPNGFQGEELCQISKYAGLGDQLSAFGIFETNPVFDINDQTSHLTAQIIWYFIEGFSRKIKELPGRKPKEFKEYIVHLNEIDQDLIFLKSVKTNRWWFKTPSLKPRTGYPDFIACSYNDYQKAGNQEIPDRWWKAFQKFN